jgi:hypothetical protein
MNSINIAPHRQRDALLRMTLAELAGWHLVATCAACRQDRIVSIQSLLEHYGGAATLLRLIPRFRCGAARCRLPPSRVLLRNRMPVQPGPKLIEIVLLDARGPAQR